MDNKRVTYRGETGVWWEIEAPASAGPGATAQVLITRPQQYGEDKPQCLITRVSLADLEVIGRMMLTRVSGKDSA